MFLHRPSLMKICIIHLHFLAYLVLATPLSHLPDSIKPASLWDFPSYRKPPELFSRDDSLCLVSNYTPCGGGAPDNFCCPRDTKCMVVAANTTALCCPNGSCGKLEPITCNVGYQNVTAYPDAPIHTVALEKELPKCGKQCCPFGYKCNSQTQCVLSDDESDYTTLVPQPTRAPTTTSKPAQATTQILSTTTTSLQISSSQVSSSVTTATSSSSARSTEASDNENKGPPTGIVTAVTVAGVCSVFGIILFFWIRKSRKRQSQCPDQPRDSGWGSWRWGPTTATNTPLLPNHIQRSADGRFIITPRISEFSSPVLSQKISPNSPVELPATPVSPCMWMNLEDAAVEEPRLAFVIPARQIEKQI